MLRSFQGDCDNTHGCHRQPYRKTHIDSGKWTHYAISTLALHMAQGHLANLRDHVALQALYGLVTPVGKVAVGLCCNEAIFHIPPLVNECTAIHP